MRSRIAEVAGCNTTYVTHVLKGVAQFSLEQSERISKRIGHSRSETEFFLLLVQQNRAGTVALRSLLLEQLDRQVSEHFDFQKRLKFEGTLSQENQAIYYSAWYFSAIHVAISLPEFQTRSALSRYFGLTEDTVNDALEFLVSRGLATQDGGKFKVGSVSLHLGKNSPMIRKHHGNWRVRAIQSMDHLRESDLHYSSVVTVSKADADRVRSIMVKAIEEIREVVKNSKDEGVFAYTFDLFSLENQSA